MSTEKRSPRKNLRIVVAVVSSSALSLIVGILANIVSGYLAPEFATRPWIVWGALGVTFLFSLPLSVYLFLRSSSNMPLEEEPASTTEIVPLPPRPYQRFFGRVTIVDEIMDALRDPEGRWAIGIDGMGGIGKTSLARVIADRSLDERLFEGVIWEPRFTDFSYGTTTPTRWVDLFVAIGRQLGAPDLHRLPDIKRVSRLAELLRQHKVLLVLDGLESAVDNQEELVIRLLPLLQFSKAILTSRRRFKGDLYTVHLEGLDEESATQLIRYEAQEKRIQRVVSAQSRDLDKIVRSTGGSPLAIKLIVGQLQHLPLEQVLSSLKEVRRKMGEDEDEYVNFYKGIFWNSWNLLSGDAKRLLISMAVFAPGIGGTFDAIEKTSGLDRDILGQKIDELWRLSFLEIGQSTLRNPRYYLHPLTQYFVVSDIVRISN